MCMIFKNKLIDAERCIIATIALTVVKNEDWVLLFIYYYYNYLLRLTQRVAYISGTFDLPVVHGRSASPSGTLYVVGCLLAAAVS